MYPDCSFAENLVVAARTQGPRAGGAGSVAGGGGVKMGGDEILWMANMNKETQPAWMGIYGTKQNKATGCKGCKGMSSVFLFRFMGRGRDSLRRRRLVSKESKAMDYDRACPNHD